MFANIEENTFMIEMEGEKNCLRRKSAASKQSWNIWILILFLNEAVTLFFMRFFIPNHWKPDES